MSSFHHAELIRSSSVNSFVLDSISKQSEVSEMILDKFGINDAKELIRLAHNRPVGSKHLTLVVRTEFITLEAQNALLKILEEPPTSTKFVFIIPPSLNLLLTLQSRFNEEISEVEEYTIGKEVFEEFLNSNYRERLSTIETAIKGKDLKWQRFMKQGLSYYVAKADRKNKTLVVQEYVARTLLTRGASNKMLLEHLALTL